MYGRSASRWCYWDKKDRYAWARSAHRRVGKSKPSSTVNDTGEVYRLWNPFGLCFPYLAIKVDVLLLVEETPLLVEGRLRGDGDVHGRAHCLWDLQKINNLLLKLWNIFFFHLRRTFHSIFCLWLLTGSVLFLTKYLYFYARRCGSGLRTETLPYRAIDRRANTFVLPQTS